jgi:hypothetical protein
MVITKQLPVLGTALLNRGDLLLRMIHSIDYPVGTLHIVVNTVCETDLGIPLAIEQITKEIKEKRLPIDNFYVQYGTDSTGALVNLGVSASWNLICSKAFDNNAPHCMIVGNDVQFTPGALKTIHEFASCAPHKGILLANIGYSAFVLTRHGWNKAGTFDENFYPAYNEDLDHMYRIMLSNAGRCRIRPAVNLIHGEAPEWGSSTINANPRFRRKNFYTHQLNDVYYITKWGGPIGKEKYKHPYNDASLDLRYWKPLTDERRFTAWEK